MLLASREPTVIRTVKKNTRSHRITYVYVSCISTSLVRQVQKSQERSLERRRPPERRGSPSRYTHGRSDVVIWKRKPSCGRAFHIIIRGIIVAAIRSDKLLRILSNTSRLCTSHFAARSHSYGCDKKVARWEEKCVPSACLHSEILRRPAASLAFSPVVFSPPSCLTDFLRLVEFARTVRVILTHDPVSSRWINDGSRALHFERRTLLFRLIFVYYSLPAIAIVVAFRIFPRTQLFFDTYRHNL